MRRVAWLGTCLMLGCTFAGSGGVSPEPDGSTAPSLDAGNNISPDASLVVDAFHVPPGGDYGGTGDLALTSTTIDTTALTIGTSLPAGVTFDMWPQEDDPTLELAVLHVRQLDVVAGETVLIRGSRPLVIIALDTVRILGTLDGGATRDIAGPGALSAGAAAGAPGVGGSNLQDSGGGGGGHATAGGRGGRGGVAGGCGGPPTPAGAAGVLAGDEAITLLVGGSPGAPGGIGDSNCVLSVPGAGGGAVQVTVNNSIEVSGSLTVGGGGGGGGDYCDELNSGGGAGGGSGGSIYLEAATITNTGTIAANGGGGGSGASLMDGSSGEDGLVDLAQAPGGPFTSDFGEAGGAGGARATDTSMVGDDDPCGGNGGGGGGAAGRVFVRGTLTGEAAISPAPVLAN